MKEDVRRMHELAFKVTNAIIASIPIEEDPNFIVAAMTLSLEQLVLALHDAGRCESATEIFRGLAERWNGIAKRGEN